MATQAIETVNITAAPSLHEQGAKIAPLSRTVNSKKEESFSPPKTPRKARLSQSAVTSSKVVMPQDIDGISAKIAKKIVKNIAAIAKNIGDQGASNFIKQLLAGNMALIVAAVGKANTQSYGALEASGASSLQATDASLQQQNAIMVQAYSKPTTEEGPSIGWDALVGIIVAVVVAVVVVAVVTVLTAGIGDGVLMATAPELEAGLEMTDLGEAAETGEGAASTTTEGATDTTAQTASRATRALNLLRGNLIKTGLTAGILGGGSTFGGIYLAADNGDPVAGKLSEQTPSEHKLRDQQRDVQQANNMSQILNQEVSKTTTLDITDGTQEQVQAQNTVQSMLSMIAQLYTIKH